MSQRATARSIYYSPKTPFFLPLAAGHALLLSTLSRPFHPNSRLHNHLPAFPSEYAAGLIQPVLLRGPVAFTFARRLPEFVRSLVLLSFRTMYHTFGNRNRPPAAHSNSMFLNRANFIVNGNRIFSDHKNGRNIIYRQ